MKEIPENYKDIKKILLNQLALIKQESELNRDNLVALTDAMCEVVNTIYMLRDMH